MYADTNTAPKADGRVVPRNKGSKLRGCDLVGLHVRDVF